MTELTIGDVAPDFNMPIQDGESVNLSALRGKFVVLYFYPKDDTPGCTIEAKAFTKLKNEFAKLNAIIIGVSKDTLHSHAKFKAKCELEFDLASDVDSNVCESYGVWAERSMFGKKYMGIKRSTFLIDPDGRIADIWPNVSVQGHAEEVLDSLKEMM